MENRLLQLPRPMLIGIRQSGLLRRFRNPQMPQFPFAGCQPLADLPQASRLSDMAEQHGHQLSPTRKPARVPLGLMLANGLLEFPPRQQSQQLREKCCILDSWRKPPEVWI